jgi:thiosulfate dehydrogenase (quinone) large subunit
MFLYAGIDKLIDPAFLRATGPGSIGEQLAVFVHVSPLAPFVSAFAVPFPVAVGLVVAVLEIAVGIAALTGILYRPAAAGGALFSLMFFLTASWDTRPIYYGPDLPYMVGWVTLALAGAGGVYVLEPRLLARIREAGLPGPLRDDGTPASAGRRTVLLVGVVGAASIVVAGGAKVFGRIVAGEAPARDAATDPLARPTPDGTASATSAAPAGSAAPGASATATAAGEIANTNDLPKASSVDFAIPNGDPGILVKLADGTIVAYDATCTHEGCPVGYDGPSGLLFCPCHGATFDPAHDAAVLAGPARRPLASVPITVDSTTGSITLTG